MAADERPLNVRVAESLGCKPHKENEDWRCGCYAMGHGGKRRFCGPNLLPYGEDTPAGWACTGPLLDLFGLSLSRGVAYGSSGAEPYVFAWRSGDYQGQRESSACAAIAAWVAEYGKEAKRG